MNIPAWPIADQREAELLQSVLGHSQWGGFHPIVSEIENRFASYQGARFGMAACNGTVTLELALELLGIGPGDEVIIPAISFVSTATAVARVGATPVFVDIESDSYNLDPQAAAAAISPKTRAILAVHFGGVPCDIRTLQAVCNQHQLTLLEDAAHAQGSELGGRRLGSFGLLSSFSFQNGKVLCCGEGGMLLTSDEHLADLCRSLINCGRLVGESYYAHHRLGTNLRMTAFQAAVLTAQFERLPAQIQKRHANVRLLKDLLSAVEEITWQREPPDMTQCSWYLLVGRLRRGSRDSVTRRMAELNVSCTPFYPHTLYQNPVFRNGVECRVEPCPEAEARVHDAFWFPHRVLLSEPEVIRQLAVEIQRTFTRQQWTGAPDAVSTGIAPHP